MPSLRCGCNLNIWETFVWPGRDRFKLNLCITDLQTTTTIPFADWTRVNCCVSSEPPGSIANYSSWNFIPTSENKHGTALSKCTHNSYIDWLLICFKHGVLFDGYNYSHNFYIHLRKINSNSSGCTVQSRHNTPNCKNNHKRRSIVDMVSFVSWKYGIPSTLVSAVLYAIYLYTGLYRTRLYKGMAYICMVAIGIYQQMI